jgi:hypothetical protein
MMTKYKCFYFELEESDTMHYVYIYYNGTQAHFVKGLTEERALTRAKEWVDTEGYEWLGVDE